MKSNEKRSKDLQKLTKNVVRQPKLLIKSYATVKFTSKEEINALLKALSLLQKEIRRLVRSQKVGTLRLKRFSLCEVSLLMYSDSQEKLSTKMKKYFY